MVVPQLFDFQEDGVNILYLCLLHPNKALRVQNRQQRLPLGRDSHTAPQKADAGHGVAPSKETRELPPLETLDDGDVVRLPVLHDGLQHGVGDSVPVHVHNILGNAHEATHEASRTEQQRLVVLQIVHDLVETRDDEAVLPRLLRVLLVALLRHGDSTLYVVGDRLTRFCLPFTLSSAHTSSASTKIESIRIDGIF